MEAFSIMSVKRHQINIDIEAELRRMAFQTGRHLVIEEYEEPEDYPTYPVAAMTVHTSSDGMSVIGTRNTWEHEYDQDTRDGLLSSRQRAAEVPQPAGADRIFNATAIVDSELSNQMEALKLPDSSDPSHQASAPDSTQEDLHDVCSVKEPERAPSISFTEIDFEARRVNEPTVSLLPNGLPVPHSCGFCSNINVNSQQVNEGQKLITSRTRHNIAEAADAGCPLFCWLEWRLYTMPDMGSGQSPFSEIAINIIANSGILNGPLQAQGTFHDWNSTENQPLKKGNFGAFTIVTAEDDLAAPYINTRPVNLTVGSENNFAVAKRWLEECQNSHEECKRESPTALPSRVLDVSDNQIKLHVSSPGETSEYIALSYCWGGDQTTKTTVANLSPRIKEIALSDLPQSLKDAVTVTRGLGIQYLWVDSLCIVQDDYVSKAKDISNMGSIYSGACLTISAASAAASDEGFLQTRAPSANRRHIFGLQYICPSGEIGRVYLYLKEKHDPQIEEPIFQRAWTLQESLLSPRTLIYGSWQIRWNCKTMNQCDGGPPAQSTYHQTLEHLARRLHSSIPLDELPAPSPSDSREESLFKLMQPHTIFELWDELVQAYTKRSLTVPADRPLAISGLAETYSKVIGGDYCAGLWSHNLLRGLMWHRPLTYNPRPPHFRHGLPSWSWTSINGEVSMYSHLITSDEGLAKVIAFNCLPKFETAPFGGAKEGESYVVIRGKIREAYFLNLSILRNSLRFLSGPGPVASSEDPTYMATASWDKSFQFSYNGDDEDALILIYCLELLPYTEGCEKGSDHFKRPAGLLLSKLSIPDMPDVYFREGVWDFEWDNLAWLVAYENGSRDHDARRLEFRKVVFDGCEVQDVIIV